MKKQVLKLATIGIIFTILGTLPTQGQNGDMIYDKGKFNLNAGIKFGFYKYGIAGNSIRPTIPLFINANFGVFEYVSVGGFFSYAGSKYEDSYGYWKTSGFSSTYVSNDFTYRYNLTEVGARGTFHAIPFLNKTFPSAEHGLDGTKYDLYITIYSGVSFQGYTSSDLRNDDDAPENKVNDFNKNSFRSVFVSPYIGGKYMFTNNFGAFVEIGGVRSYSPFEGNLGLSLVF